MMRHAALPCPALALRAIGSVRNFAPHQTIFAEGEPAPHFMLVIHGMVRSCSNFADGRRFIGAFYAGGDIFGLERNPAHMVSAEAVSDTAIVLYPAPDWFTVCHAQDDLSLRIFSAMMRGFEQAQSHARLLARLRAIEKLALFLLECHERSPHAMLVTLEMTRLDIADYLGLTVETVSRSLAQLKRERLIDLRSSRLIDLLDIPALREISA